MITRDMVMQATERNFCVSRNESIKKGRIPSREAWANLCSVNASFAGLCVSAGLRHRAGSSPSSGGSRALGQAVLSAVLDFVRPRMQGRIFPPLKPPRCRDVLQVRFASACLVLLWQMRRMGPQSVMGQEGEPCWRSASSWAAPVPSGPPGCAGCTGQALAMAHSGPLSSSHNKVLTPNSGSCLAPQGWRDAKGVGAKSFSTAALKLALTNALSKKLCYKSLVWKENNSFHWSPCFLLIMQNINAWLIPKITATGIFSL